MSWLKQHLKEGKVESVNQADSNFISQLELAVRFGKTLIVEQVETIEPALFPLLRADLVSQGKISFVYCKEVIRKIASGG